MTNNYLEQKQCARAIKMKVVLSIMGVAALGILVFVLVTAQGVEASTITVNDNGGADYRRIQDAIDNADEGDTIRVYRGTYYESVVVNKKVDLIGNGSANTTIYGNKYDDGVKITADWVNLSGFRVTKSRWGSPSEACIKVESNHNTIFENNCSNNEHGIYIRRSYHNTLFDNTCMNNDYGIYLYSSWNNTFINNSCLSNNEIGMKFRYSFQNVLIYNSYSNNDYGIYLYSSWNNTFINNSCLSNNEIGMKFRYSTLNVLINNSVLNSDYGINLHSSWNNTFQYNSITGNRIGIHLNNSKNNTIHYCEIFGNTEYGITTTNNISSSINASYNNWGDPSGPFHPGNNPEGKGDNVTDYVDFYPWLGNEFDSPPVAHIYSISPNPAVEGQKVSFVAKDTVDSVVERYFWSSSIDGGLYNDTSSTFSTTRLTPGNHTISLKAQNDLGVWSQEVAENLTILPMLSMNQPPVLTILHPENNSVVSGIVSIQGTVYDPESNSTYVEVIIDGGEWLKITNISLWNYQFETTQLKNGGCFISFRAFDGQNYSNSQTLYLILKNDKDETEGGFILPNPTTAGIIAICFFCFLGTAYLRENIRFALHSILTIPLYTTLKKDDVLSQVNRQTIFRYLTKNPGANYTRIKKELNFGTSTLVYHLAVLEREELIRSKKEVGKRMFYPKDSRWNPKSGMVGLLTTPVQNRIFTYLEDHGPASMRDIEKALSLKQQSVSYNIRRLVERKQVMSVGKKRNALYMVFEDPKYGKNIDAINDLSVIK